MQTQKRLNLPKSSFSHFWKHFSFSHFPENTPFAHALQGNNGRFKFLLEQVSANSSSKDDSSNCTRFKSLQTLNNSLRRLQKTHQYHAIRRFIRQSPIPNFSFPNQLLHSYDLPNPSKNKRQICSLNEMESFLLLFL